MGRPKKPEVIRCPNPSCDCMRVNRQKKRCPCCEARLLYLGEHAYPHYLEDEEPAYYWNGREWRPLAEQFPARPTPPEGGGDDD